MRSSTTTAKNVYGPQVVYDYSNDHSWYGYTFVSVRVPVTQVNTVAWYVDPEQVRHENIIMGRVIGWFQRDKEEPQESKPEESQLKRSSTVSYSSSFIAYCERRAAWDWADLPRPDRECCDFLDFDSYKSRLTHITITSSEDAFYAELENVN